MVAGDKLEVGVAAKGGGSEAKAKFGALPPGMQTGTILGSPLQAMNEDGWYTSFVPRPKAQAVQKSPSKRRETVNVSCKCPPQLP